MPQRAATGHMSPRSTSHYHAQRHILSCPIDHLHYHAIGAIRRHSRKRLEPMWRAIATASSAPGARHSAKNQRPGKSRQPRKQLASCTLIPFVTITQTLAAAAGALTPTPVCPAAVCTAPIATCAAHPRPAPKAAKRQLARHAARLSDINTHHGEEYTAKRCAGSHMPRLSGPTWHFGCFATRHRLGDATRCQNRVLRHASFLLRS